MPVYTWGGQALLVLSIATYGYMGHPSMEVLNGSAGGYGYDKQFAALHEAVNNSGIKMLNQQHDVEKMLLGIAYSLDVTKEYKVF